MAISKGLVSATITALFIAALLLVPGSSTAGEDATAASSSPAGDAPAASPSSKRVVLRLKNSRFGKVIHDKKSGLVAYIFTKETKGKSECYGSCAKGWPPIKTKGKPKAGKGLKQRHIGTTKRRNGAKMVTYKKQPLYFYEHDAPGVILCHDVFQYGGDWFVIKKNGKPA